MRPLEPQTFSHVRTGSLPSISARRRRNARCRVGPMAPNGMLIRTDTSEYEGWSGSYSARIRSRCLSWELADKTPYLGRRDLTVETCTDVHIIRLIALVAGPVVHQALPAAPRTAHDLHAFMTHDAGEPTTETLGIAHLLDAREQDQPRGLEGILHFLSTQSVGKASLRSRGPWSCTTDCQACSS